MARTGSGTISCRVVFITTGSMAEGRRLARRLVGERLAACVNLVPGIESLFWWQGKVDRASEVLLIVKTTAARLSLLIDRVRAWHSYQTPEVIAVPIVHGSAAYLRWLCDSCAPQRSRAV